MNNWIIGRRWHPVQCAPRGELLAAWSAREAGWTVFHPRYEEPRFPAKKKPYTAILPYLPGYIFVAGDRFLSISELCKRPGVHSVLKTGEDFALIPDTDPVMRKLLAMADEDGMVEREEARKPITLYKAGDAIQLQNCPFALQSAVIEMVDDNREGATVWLNIFGGPVKMHVKHDQIGEVITAA